MNVTIPLVAPVRFSGGGLSMQSTISRLGPEGLFVRSLVSPKEASRMELSLSLPGAALPLRMTGIVGPRPADVGRNAGFWVMFEGMSDDTRAFLDTVLRGRGSGATRMLERPAAPPRDAPQRPARKPGGEEGRAYPRVPARLRVGWTSSADFLSAWSENISRGGIFIATDTPPPLREVVELSVELPDGKPPVKTHAEVVHCVTPEQARKTKTLAGAGLQFLDADDDFRARLDACIQALGD